jgi:hypothetical protein
MESGHVPCKPIDGSLVLVQPIGVKFSDHGGDVEEISIVEMVVVIIAIAKVDVHIGGASLIDDSAPRRLIGRDCGRGRLEPVIE